MDNFDYKAYLRNNPLLQPEDKLIKESEDISEKKYKQGYDDREDESLGARRGAEKGKKQSFKDRRDDSYGKFGKRDAEAKGKDKGPGKNRVNKEGLAEKKEDSKKGNKEEQKRMEGAIRDDRDHIKDLEKDIKDNEKKLAKLKADEPKDVNESEDIEEYGNKPMYDEDDRDSMKEEKEDMEDKMDDEEIDLEDMSEDDLKGFIEDVIKDMVSAGEIEPGDEFVEDEIEVEDVEDVDVDVEIDEAKEIEEGEEVTEAEELDEKMSDPVMRKGDDEKKKGKFKPESKPERETEKMREELEAAISQVNELKAELNEVNLLNAKLLYTNKIFKAKNLNESKKVKVLKAFDKAKDVAQAKTIYETLNEGLLDKSSINENRIKGSASKATGLEPKSTKSPIIESNDVYNRMRQLAGLL